MVVVEGIQKKGRAGWDHVQLTAGCMNVQLGGNRLNLKTAGESFRHSQKKFLCSLRVSLTCCGMEEVKVNWSSQRGREADLGSGKG